MSDPTLALHPAHAALAAEVAALREELAALLAEVNELKRQAKELAEPFGLLMAGTDGNGPQVH